MPKSSTTNKLPWKEWLQREKEKKKKVNLYEVAPFLREGPRELLGVYLPNLYIFVQDPLIAGRDKALGINPVEVLWEPGLGAGPTSARLAVVDFDATAGTLHPPVEWDEETQNFRWWDEQKQHGPFLWNQERNRFESCDGVPLAGDHASMYKFHQVNLWAIVQNTLEIFESQDVMGRRIPWGVDGNRLILVPHAGYMANAFYNRAGKSLQFYYCGDSDHPTYNCLSYDIIAHETGHAILDGIRPYYYDFSSIQTAAFHEFFADMTAMLTTLRNNVVRRNASSATDKGVTIDNVITNLAEQLGNEVHSGKPVRDMASKLTMADIRTNTVPHDCSLVLTGAIFDIFQGVIAEQMKIHPEKSPLQNLWSSTQRIIRMALQPIDFLPPVDVQFVDYFQAFLHYFNLFEPPLAVSPSRAIYEKLITRVFRERGFRIDVRMLEKIMIPGVLAIYHPIEEIACSRTGAYHFLNDNRRVLHIPDRQDFKVLEVYEARKYGRDAARLPRQYVVQYVWSEEFPLQGKRFGLLQGKIGELLCGGTLVFDSMGNILSWMRKPGVEDCGNDKENEAGAVRKAALLDHLASQAASGRIGLQEAGEAQVTGPWTPGVVAAAREGLLHLEIHPSVRKTFADAGNVDETPLLFESGTEK